MLKKTAFYIALVLIVLTHSIPNIYPQETISHDKFNTVLSKFVADGLVNYKALKGDPVDFLDYLQELSNIKQGTFKRLPDNEKKTFWINTYNALTIYAILNNYPIKPGGFIARNRFPANSIRQIDKVWETIHLKVIGRELTLDDIEHKILRKEFSDPRIHFAIVCASIGCPKLRSEVFKATALETQLEQASSEFINNEYYVKLEKESKTIYLSSIFKWYAEDFTEILSDERINKFSKGHRGIISFICERIDEDRKTYILNNKPKIKYLDYDWTLNEQK